MNIAFIPVRGGSKSIPYKNIKQINGKPLVYWTVKAAQDAICIDKVIVATDDINIKTIVDSFKFNKVFVYDREKENAQDHSSTESVMLEYINKNYLQDDDYFFLIQATSPFLESSHIDEMFKEMIDGSFDSALTCVRTKRFFWNHNGEPINYDYKNRPRRQDFEGIFMENGACYINSVANIKKYKNRLFGKISIYVMPDYTGFELDEEDDWFICEFFMKKYILSKNKSKIKLFVSDVDGVLTDSGMYYSENGDELKKFNTKDGMGFQILKENNIKTAIITSENTKMVERRTKKLNIDFLFQGVKDKKEIILNLCKNLNISPDEIAYIGDDINDLECIKLCGLTACPNDAIKIIKNFAHYISPFNGGQGAVRDFVEYIFTDLR